MGGLGRSGPVAQWWGPDGFETPPDSVAIELRQGGRFDLLMVDPRTGGESRVHQEILEVSGLLSA